MVAKNLIQGSAPSPLQKISKTADVLVLCASQYQPPACLFPGVRVVRAGIRDDVPTQKEIEIAMLAAYVVAQELHRGKRCLVTCMAGLNRSGLVSGLALRYLGWSGRDASRAVRAARGQHALSNPWFRAIVEDT